MSSGSVLYDAPGPRARRRIAAFTLLGGVAIAALLVFVVLRLADRGQFSMELWGPLLNPADERFELVWPIIGEGLVNTLKAAVLAMLLSVVIGTLITVTRLSLGRTGRLPLIGLVELLRGVPVVVSIYFASRVLPDVGLSLSGRPGGAQLWYLVIGLTAYNSVIFAEIVRAGVLSLPRGQRESALAIGLTDGQAMRLVLLPQAFRVMLPAIISQLVVVLKDTSLIAFVGNYDELLSASERLVQNLGNPIQVFTVTAVIYISINYALSKLAEYLERRLSRSSKSAAGTTQVEAPTAGA